MGSGNFCARVGYSRNSEHSGLFFIEDIKLKDPVERRLNALQLSDNEFVTRSRMVRATGNALLFFSEQSQHAGYSEGELTALARYEAEKMLEPDTIRGGRPVVAYENLQTLGKLVVPELEIAQLHGYGVELLPPPLDSMSPAELHATLQGTN